MSKENYTHIIAIIDRSGSMGTIRNDMQGGFDSFVKTQKEAEGMATLTLVQFDNAVETVHENVDIAEVPSFNLEPRGMTALLDAIGTTLDSERARILAMSEEDAPEQVLCVIITDGHENSSREYTRDSVFEMITDLSDSEDLKWEFVFLGANQNAISDGGDLGIRQQSAMTYDASSEGATRAFDSLSCSTVNYRSKVSDGYSFSQEDRKAQEELLNKDINPIMDHMNTQI